LGELFGLKEERTMAQPVTAIMSHQNDLAAKAFLVTRDTNEAGLLVGKVISRAFKKFQHNDSAETIAAALHHDLDRLIEGRQAAN
jgi:hypothetical protein